MWINDAHMVNCALPFGGYKQSGIGRELGPHAIDEYVETKTSIWTSPSASTAVCTTSS